MSINSREVEFVDLLQDLTHRGISLAYSGEVLITKVFFSSHKFLKRNSVIGHLLASQDLFWSGYSPKNSEVQQKNHLRIPSGYQDPGVHFLHGSSMVPPSGSSVPASCGSLATRSQISVTWWSQGGISRWLDGNFWGIIDYDLEKSLEIFSISKIEICNIVFILLLSLNHDYIRIIYCETIKKNKFTISQLKSRKSWPMGFAVETVFTAPWGNPRYFQQRGPQRLVRSGQPTNSLCISGTAKVRWKGAHPLSVQHLTVKKKNGVPCYAKDCVIFSRYVEHQELMESFTVATWQRKILVMQTNCELQIRCSS